MQGSLYFHRAPSRDQPEAGLLNEYPHLDTIRLSQIVLCDIAGVAEDQRLNSDPDLQK